MGCGPLWTIGGKGRQSVGPGPGDAGPTSQTGRCAAPIRRHGCGASPEPAVADEFCRTLQLETDVTEHAKRFNRRLGPEAFVVDPSAAALRESMFREIATLGPPHRFGPWVKQIARNIARNLRARRPRYVSIDRVSVVAPTADDVLLSGKHRRVPIRRVDGALPWRRPWGWTRFSIPARLAILLSMART